MTTKYWKEFTAKSTGRYNITKPDFIKKFNLDNSKKMLVIGDTFGRETKLLTKMAQVYVLDVNPAYEEQIKQFTPYFFYTPDGKHFPFEDGLFDVVYCLHVVQHISKTDLPTFFTEVSRVLKNDGKFGFQFLSGRNYGGSKDFYANPLLINNGYDIQELQSFMPKKFKLSNCEVLNLPKDKVPNTKQGWAMFKKSHQERK